MATDLAVSAGYLAILLMGAAVVGTVERRERFLFAAGVAVLLVGLTLLSGTVGAAVALVGMAAIVGAAVPLLLE